MRYIHSGDAHSIAVLRIIREVRNSSIRTSRPRLFEASFIYFWRLHNRYIRRDDPHSALLR